MTKKIDWDKPLRTIDGLYPVRLVSDDRVSVCGYHNVCLIHVYIEEIDD